MNESAYFTERAQRHRRLAELAPHPSARVAHEQLASAYEARATDSRKAR